MSDRTVIGLEGLPFTGKSSVAAALQEAFPAVSVIADYHELLPPAERVVLAALSDSAADQRQRVEMYRDLDDRRWKLADQAEGTTVVLDRCFVSIAAYRVALHRTFGTTVWHSAGRAAAAISCERPVPPLIVHLAVGVDIAVDRHRRLSTTIDSRLQTSEFLSNLITAYTEVLSRCGSTVVSIDSNRDLPTVIHTAKEHLHALIHP
ncbi:AAA family ATPase [Nocardia brasiliensis]|uniref:AAA family ATPase n=1 Tax=Nocardia brasiliensis TaxID=37326 RepID=UPI0024558078|nr:AAA family ATPase [Nocardia brasiliensis]